MLNIIKEISEYIGKDMGINEDYVKLTILTIFVFIVFGILKAVIKKIYSDRYTL